MTIYILVETLEDAPHARAAFSSEQKRQDYLDENDDIETPKFDFLEIESSHDEATAIRRIYAAHSREKTSGRVQLAGYFTQQYEAVVSAGKDGHVVELDIDQIEYVPEETKAVERQQDPSFKIVRKKHVEKPSILMDEELIPLPVSSRDRKPFLLLVVLVLALVGMFSFFFIREPVQVGVDVPRVDWLPPTCSNVSYYLSPNLEAYEFRCSSNNFKAWANNMGLEIRKIGNEPVRVATYRNYINSEMDPSIAGLPEEEQWQRWEALSRPTIKVGFEIIASSEGDDWSVGGAYDWREGIAYFWRKRN